MSLDGGVTWSPGTNCLSDKNIAYYYLTVDNQIIYLIYEGIVNSDTGLFFQKSLDFGLQWTPPKQLIALKKFNRSESNTSINVTGNYIFIAGNFSRTKGTIEKPLVDIQFFRSGDLGDNWSEVQIIDLADWAHKQKSLRYPLGNYQIEYFHNALWLGFKDRGFNIINSSDNGTTWSKPRKLWDFEYFQMVSCPIDTDQVAVIWNDSRDAYHPKWAEIPLLGDILAGDENPYWENNEVYYALLGDDAIVKSERLTPYLSFSEQSPNTLSCGRVQDNVMVFWSGKSKVGKGVQSSPGSFEIFYKIIKTAD